MIKTLTLRLAPEIGMQTGELRAYVLREEGLTAERLCAMVVRRRSIDARSRRPVVQVTLDLYIDEPMPAPQQQEYPDVSQSPHRAIVVGAGPAGLFAALRLVQLGVKPLVLERGRDVHTRRRDIARISREHHVDAESNFSFGEGGAGAFSDGKLFTRSKKRGDISRILQILVQHGADPAILVEAHPHIGTDRLPAIIERMRRQIETSGGEVRFGARVDALLFEKGEVVGVRTATDEHLGPVILATGHSARDTYRHLLAEKVPTAPKGIAIGVRLEHPAELVDAIQYHTPRGRRPAHLPAAEYAFTAQVEGRGVYSFCMCPGGVVVPAASGPEQVVVNGMSASNRGGRWSNSGMVVEVRTEDVAQILAQIPSRDSAQPFGALLPEEQMLLLQERLERLAWQQGGGSQTAPAQRMTDFVNRRLTDTLPASSYTPGLLASPLHFWMPPFLSQRLAEGFRQFGRRSHGFLTSEATVIAVETRTSSPMRILRDAVTLASPRHPRLFPAGEGAGYAGGIVSAAMDGERAAEALAAIWS